MSPPPELEEVLELLDSVGSREERIDLLMSLANRLRPVPERIARRPYPETHRVAGCESQVYIWAERRPDGTADFHFAVENPQGVTAQALAAILQQTCSGVPAEQIRAIPEDVIFRIFGRELSIAKITGLTGVIRKLQTLAEQR
jgi:cysteine desulfuration protein SufE